MNKSSLFNLSRIIFITKTFLKNSYILTAAQIWDLGQEKQNTMDFAEAVDESDLEAFGFTDDFIFELWGAITDAKAGRLRK